MNDAIQWETFPQSPCKESVTTGVILSEGKKERKIKKKKAKREREREGGVRESE